MNLTRYHLPLRPKETYIYRLFTAGTIEFEILKRQSGKIYLANKVVDNADHQRTIQKHVPATLEQILKITDAEKGELQGIDADPVLKVVGPGMCISLLGDLHR